MKLLKYIIIFILCFNVLTKVKKHNKKSKKKHRKLFFPGFAQTLEALPNFFMQFEYNYGDMVGGNVNLKLKAIDNPMVINSFESTTFVD